MLPISDIGQISHLKGMCGLPSTQRMGQVLKVWWIPFLTTELLYCFAHQDTSLEETTHVSMAQGYKFDNASSCVISCKCPKRKA